MRTRSTVISGVLLAGSLGLVSAAWPADHVTSRPALAAKATTSTDPRWWSFRPLHPVPVPAVKDPRWSANPIDRFIRSAQIRKGLAPSPPADARTLIRRVYFDLIGLPPTPDEVESFVRECSAEQALSVKPWALGTDPRAVKTSSKSNGLPLRPNAQRLTPGGAYERLVDRLLASPHYGERWGRHWLDVARYADSDGQESDADRPTAHHYRDFVIRALNEDLPYDTFVRWQLAGDEYEPDNPLAVAATGFVVAGPYTFLEVPMEEEKVRCRLNELDDMLSTTGQALLGLTVGCARCHDHKYDPIPTRDYYRLQAIFNSGDRTQVPLIPRAEAAARQAAEAAWKARLDTARRELDGWLAEQKKPLTARVREARIEALPIEAAEKALLKNAPEDRRAKELAQRFARQLRIEDADYRPLLSEAQRGRWDELAAAVQQIEAEKPAPVPTAFAMRDFGAQPRPTWLLDRGDMYLKKEQVQIGFLTALTSGLEPAGYWTRAKAAGARNDTTYQRRALADWITDTEHGAGALLARVIVNRVWQHHFGEGLVRTVNDFGLRGERPTHPALLEWLASAFASAATSGRGGMGERVNGSKGEAFAREVSHSPAPPFSHSSPNEVPATGHAMGWSLKKLHRLIVLSSAYRQGLHRNAAAERKDPENRLLWRRRPQRIEAEIFRDSMLTVSGTLNRKAGGPAVKAPIQPEALQARNVTNPYPANLKDTPETCRRSVYLFHKRVVQSPLLQAFDSPDAVATCGRRAVTTVAPQALAVLNEPFIRLRAAEFARRLQAEAGTDPAAQVERAYRLALARSPSPAERRAALRFLEQQSARRAERDGQDARIFALTDFAQVLFGLNEFLYVD
jgi:hypothetical protein